MTIENHLQSKSTCKARFQPDNSTSSHQTSRDQVSPQSKPSDTSKFILAYRKSVCIIVLSPCQTAVQSHASRLLYLYLATSFLTASTYFFWASSGLRSLTLAHSLYFALPCKARNNTSVLSRRRRDGRNIVPSGRTCRVRWCPRTWSRRCPA